LQTDTRGTVWAAALGSGLLRVREGPERGTAVVEPFSDPKITGSVQAVYVDRDDNVWVGMRGGLLRVSESVVLNVAPLAGLLNEGVRGLTVSGDGSVWVATSYALNRFGPNGPQTFDIEQTQALHTDRAGTVWVVTLRGVSRYTDGRFVPVNMPQGFRFEGILSFTSDGAGGLWFCNYRAGLVRWDRDGLNRFEDAPAVARRPCGSTYTDRGGRVWIGFTTGGVAVYENGSFETFGEKEGLGSGSVTAIVEDRTGAIWVSTSGGISRFQGGGFIALTNRNGLPERIGTSLAEDDAGFLWASVDSGIVRFDPREPDRVRANPDYQVPYTLYDRSDGLPAALGSLSRPSTVRGDSGTLWFATTSGVFVIEPRRLGTGHGAASVRVENVLADGRPLDSTRLPAAAPPDSTIEIGYTAVSLSTATKLRFRHKLDGFDRDWVYAGGRRQTSYANLAPGDYRFRVAATNDGLWKEPEAVFDFTVRPPFYQANWFYLLCATALALTAWAYWQVHLRAMRSKYALVLAERARVSRDIHDTLLQSLCGVGLELEVVARVISESNPSATDTVRALQRRVAECIREARQSVWDLRSPTLEHKGLGEALREVAANAATASTARIDVSERGKAKPFSRQAQEELLRIAREAIGNAVRHAHPKHVTVELAFEPDTVLLRVTDDGCGFIPASVRKGSEHCGLVNMQERAAGLKGTLRVASTPGSGTVIEAAIPLATPS
jgi:signal transduction histidine kinase